MGDKGIFFVRTGINGFGNISRGKRFFVRLDLGLSDTNLRLLKGAEFTANENGVLEVKPNGVLEEVKPNENGLLEGAELLEVKPNGVLEVKPNENGLLEGAELLEVKPNENGLLASLVEEEKKLNGFASFDICGSNENGIFIHVKKNETCSFVQSRKLF